MNQNKYIYCIVLYAFILAGCASLGRGVVDPNYMGREMLPYSPGRDIPNPEYVQQNLPLTNLTYNASLFVDEFDSSNLNDVDIEYNILGANIDCSNFGPALPKKL